MNVDQNGVRRSEENSSHKSFIKRGPYCNVREPRQPYSEAVYASVRIKTQEVARRLGIDPAKFRLLLRKGKVKAPPILLDPKTNSTVRMWSEDDIAEARNVVNSIRAEDE
jgi:hypothetical protein